MSEQWQGIENAPVNGEAVELLSATNTNGKYHHYAAAVWGRNLFGGYAWFDANTGRAVPAWVVWKYWRKVRPVDYPQDAPKAPEPKQEEPVYIPEPRPSMRKNVFYMARDPEGNFLPRYAADTVSEAWTLVIMSYHCPRHQNCLYGGDKPKARDELYRKGYRIVPVRVSKTCRVVPHG